MRLIPSLRNVAFFFEDSSFEQKVHSILLNNYLTPLNPVCDQNAGDNAKNFRNISFDNALKNVLQAKLDSMNTVVQYYATKLAAWHIWNTPSMCFFEDNNKKLKFMTNCFWYKIC